jgi:hypothetical protein
VTLHDGLEEIGEKAFAWCKSLHDIFVPPTVKLIKYDAFHYCSGLTNEFHNAMYERQFFIYTGQEVGDVPEDVTHIRVHTTVKVIMAWAFRGCKGLVCVILNDGLEEIGAGAFKQCTSLQQVVMSPNIKAIKDYAFSYCRQLTTVRFCDGLEEIGKKEFGRCKSLRDIIIPSGVKAIKSRAFYCCSGLKAVTLGDGLEEIGGEAF